MTFNIIILGHTDHGKTTLKAALGNHDSYNFVDCGGHAETVKKLIVGPEQWADTAILVISALDGPMPQTHQQIDLARGAGISKFVVFLNKMDSIDDDMAEMVEMDVQDLLGDDTPIVRGSALEAFNGDEGYRGKITELIAALKPIRAEDMPFLMPVAEAFNVVGRGTYISGTIARGKVGGGNEIELVGTGGSQKVTLQEVQMQHKVVHEAGPGDNVNLVASIHKDQVAIGMVAAKPDSIKAFKKFNAAVYVLTRKEGNQTGSLMKVRRSVSLHLADIFGSLEFPEGVELIGPGEWNTVEITLDDSVAMEVGMRFNIRAGFSPFTVGVITEIVE